jgi:DNA (cytosine-5)-methyltransferase 1
MRDLLSGLPPIPGRSFDGELIVDCFAGGGGASEGIFQATGRHPDIAVNHDAQALAMHRANHPETLHVSKNIWQVDPMELCHNRPVGLLWASPDCKHHSKAKGGRPVKRNIRDLGWTVVTWAKRARPRVIILENVEEYRDWGPVVPDEDGKLRPCRKRKGQTFKEWVRQLRRLGYKVEWRELRACDYGTPTIRKRLFVIARRDGLPIVWPEPTHGAPEDADVLAGKKLPWRTAAEIIDWSLPCPSIFDTSEEIFKKLGIRAKRPLAEATMSRIARGVFRYVIEAQKPFIVVCNHGGDWFRGQGIDEPLQTLTASRDGFGVVAPIVSYAQQGGGNRPATAPLHTITASAKDQNAIVVPTLVGCGGRAGQSAPRGGDMPLGTQTAKADTCVVSAFLAKHNTGATGAPLADPAPTITANGAGKRQGGAAPIGLVSASMLSLRGSDRRDYPADAPTRTDSAGGSHEAVVSAFISRQFGNSIGSGIDTPIGTLTAGGGGKAAYVAAFLDTYYGTDQALSLHDPMGADTTRDRRSLVTVEIDGTTYAIVDIGMRMLTPRERFRAQGFRDDYRIETGIDEGGNPVTLSQSAQGRMCGNSVCPPLAKALVAANCPDLAVQEVAA